IEGVKDFGRIHKIVVPGFATPLVQLAVPDEVAKVFYLEPKYPKRVDIPIITHFMEEKKKKGVFFNDGHEWYRHRSVISKRMLRPKEVAAYSPMLNDVVTDFMNRLEKIREKASSEFQHEVKDLNKELFKWSFESIAFVLLERRFGCLSDEMNQEARLFIDAVHGWLESVFPVTLLPLSFYKFYKTKPYKQFMSSFENMYKYAEMFIDMRVKELQQQGKLEAGSSAQSDDRHVGFFEFLIANGELSREDILASVIDLIFAGVETTSNTMLWSLYMLGKNQDKQDILYEEITSVLKPGEIPSVDAIGKMPYLKAWIKESLRLYPVLQSNTRLLQDDIVLCGYHVPAGTHVNILSYFMGRDESIFKDAAKFLPERWLRDSDNHTPGVPHAFAVLPFGFGTRMCVGRRIAELEMHLLLARIVHEYQVNNIADPNVIIFDMSKDDRKDFYRTIAKGIKRPLFAIYRRVLRMYDRRNYVGKYTTEEVKQLKLLKEKHGNDWATIGIAMGRSASSVKDRYRLLRENCQSGKWTSEEEERLSNAVHELSGTQTGEVVTTGISWANIADKVQTRSEKQCRSKWLNYLNWKEKGGNEWTKQDEIKLINKIYDIDVDDENMIDWKCLMANWTSVRSPQWLRSKWWALKKHIPSNYINFREMVEYLHLNYVDTLQTKIERQESRYKNNRLPHTTYGSVLRNLHQPASHPSNITHTITVNSDGSIVTKGDDNSHGFANQGRFEVLQLNSVSSPDISHHSQSNQLQPSYIIHSMQSTSMAGQTYIIQQPTLVDNGTVQGDQVQISPQGVVMAAVLHPHHAVRCLPEVNPELAQAIVQTDISGPIEATDHLVQTELSIDQTQEQLQAHSELTGQVHLVSLPSQTTLINDSSHHEIESSSGNVDPEEVVTAVRDHSTGMAAVTNNSLTTQRSVIHGDMSQSIQNQIITTSHYQTGPAAIAQSLDGTELCAPSSSQQVCGVRNLQVTPLSSLVTTYTTPVFSTQTSACAPDPSQHALQKETNEESLEIPASVSHATFPASENLLTSRTEELQGSSSGLVPNPIHGQQPDNTLTHNLGEVTSGDDLAGATQVSHHALTNSNPNLSDSDLVPQADLPEQFLQSQADDAVELSLHSSSSTDIVMSSEVSGVTAIHPELSHADIPASQVVVSISDVTMATFASSDSLIIMGHDGEECVIVEEGNCQ
ncbi:hypothetical protein QZH41_010113, partial [Actinostola sp. cb2023]